MITFPMPSDINNCLSYGHNEGEWRWLIGDHAAHDVLKNLCLNKKEQA